MIRKRPMDKRSGIFTYRFVLSHDFALVRGKSALLEGGSTVWTGCCRGKPRAGK